MNATTHEFIESMTITSEDIGDPLAMVIVNNTLYSANADTHKVLGFDINTRM